MCVSRELGRNAWQRHFEKFPRKNTKLSWVSGASGVYRNEHNVLSVNSHFTSLCDTVLENRGTATVHIRDNNKWREGGGAEVTQYVNQSMGFSCEIWQRCFVVTRGPKQPPTSCIPCLWPLTREQVSVHPEWLFQLPHLDAGAKLEKKWIDSLFHSQFINSEGLEVEWPTFLNFFSLGRSYRHA